MGFSHLVAGATSILDMDAAYFKILLTPQSFGYDGQQGLLFAHTPIGDVHVGGAEATVLKGRHSIPPHSATYLYFLAQDHGDGTMDVYRVARAQDITNFYYHDKQIFLDNAFGSGGSNPTINQVFNSTLQQLLDKQAIQQINGTDVEDVIRISSNGGSAFGEAGEDAIYGSARKDTIYGGAGDDTIFGADSDDLMFGGAGDDLLNCGKGSNELDGGDGTDTADFSSEARRIVTKLMAAATAEVEIAGVTRDTIQNIENLIGGSGNDVLAGDVNANRILGGDGSDLLSGDSGQDVMDGGEGIDTADYSEEFGSITIQLNRSVPTRVKVGEAASDTVSNIENVIGGRRGDHLTGDTLVNILEGRQGNDVLLDASPNNLFAGGDGDDTIALRGVDFNGSADGGNDFDILSARGNLTKATIQGIEELDILLDTSMTVKQIGQFRAVKFDDTVSGAKLEFSQAGVLDLSDAGKSSAFLSSNPDDAAKQIITGSRFSDTIDGGKGNDLIAGAGVQLDGAGAEHSAVASRAQANELYGGEGIDTVVYNQTRSFYGPASVAALEEFIKVSIQYQQGESTLKAAFSYKTTNGEDKIYSDVEQVRFSDQTIDTTDLFKQALVNWTIDQIQAASLLLIGAPGGAIAYEAITITLEAARYVYNFTEDKDHGRALFVEGAVLIPKLLKGLAIDKFLKGAPDSEAGGVAIDIVSSKALEWEAFVREAANRQYDLVAKDGLTAAEAINALKRTYVDALAHMTAGPDQTITEESKSSVLDFGHGLQQIPKGGKGNDQIDLNKQGVNPPPPPPSIWLGQGNDHLKASPNSLVAFGEDGNDNIVGYHQTSTAQQSRVSSFEMPATDLFFGSVGNDTLDGGDGDDKLWGGADRDSLVGGLGEDELNGEAEQDQLLGGGGSDLLLGGAGADTLNGGAGLDTASYEDSKGGITVNLANPAANTGIALGDRFFQIEKIIGTAFNDRLVGDANANILDAGTGADTLQGATGNDTYVVDQENDQVVELSGQGQDTVTTESNFSLTAGASIEVLRAADPEGRSPIKLTGNELSQTIVGNKGANIITGGLGADLLYSGGDTNARDAFVILQIGDSGRTAAAADRIFAFDPSEGRDDKTADIIDLHLLDADSSRPGDQKLRFVTSFSDPVGAQAEGQLMLATKGSTASVLIDIDGDKSTDMMLQIVGVTRLSQADFVL